jgi:SAM-dependent methyltransferase
MTETKKKPTRLERMNKKARLQDSWIWPDCVNDFVQSRMQQYCPDGYSLNVCAGVSEIGDVKLDLDPADRSIIQGDMRQLPFDDETFDLVICDPPWKIGYYQRFRPFFELVRVLKRGGVLIFNAYWMGESNELELLEAVIRRDTDWGNLSIISIHRRLPEEGSGQMKIGDYDGQADSAGGG